MVIDNIFLYSVQISHYKIPKHVIFMEAEAFPMTVSGKVQKFKLQETVV